MQYAAETIIPMTLELGGKSPNIFFADVMDKDDAFLDKALEGFALFAFNKGEVCTCPSRALVQESIFDKFMEKAVARVAKIKVGDPLDPTTQMGAQCSKGQLEKILNYIDVGKKEGAKCMTGGEQAHLGGALENGFYVKPTVFVGHNKMRIFQEEIFGPVLSVTKFKTMEEAIEIGNDTIYGLGAGVWSRDGATAYRVGREIQAGRVWTNCYHVYPAHAAFGGYKQSGFGRETHKMILDHYQQTKNLLVSYSPNAIGLLLTSRLGAAPKGAAAESGVRRSGGGAGRLFVESMTAEGAMIERLVFTPEAVALVAALKAAARAADLSSLGRMLRGQRADVLPAERFSRRRERRAPGRGRRLPVLCRSGAIRVLVGMPDHRRRHDRGRRQLFAGGG